MNTLNTLLVYILSFLGIFIITLYIINLNLNKNRRIDEEDTSRTISIIIPAYNEEKSIEKTIQTALNLEYPTEKVEIIVIDDGSKDKTYKLAKKFEKNKRIKVYTKPNGGKGSALNLGISKAKGEIIVTMDADTFAKPDCLKKMTAYFNDKDVMSVTPSMGVYNPKTILQRIQHIEYHLGTFLRNALYSINSINVTPGAFSAYRKSFFDKYGGFDEGNLTEDLEIALRIQKNDYIIANAPKAVIYTISPTNFRQLLYQRRRWYLGEIINLVKYSELFHPKKGILGAMVLPLTVFSIIFPIILSILLIIDQIKNVRTELSLLNSIGFDFSNFFEFNKYIFENMFYTFFSSPLSFLGIIFLATLIVYVYYSKSKMRSKDRVHINFIWFLLFYSYLFSFWWIISFIYFIFNRNVSWRYTKK